MKSPAQRVINLAAYNKVFEWTKLVTITGSAQVVVQAVGFVSGILVIRALPVQEYALYTLANTMLGTMTILADGGIASGVMAQGGKVWQSREKLGLVIATGLDLRKKFAVGSLAVSIPVLLLLLHHHNTSWLMAGLIVLSIIPVFYTTLSGTLLQTASKLHQNIIPLQKNQVGANLARLGVLTLTIFLYPWAVTAIIATGLPQLWANNNLRKISGRYADFQQAPDPVIREQILRVVKRILPGSIYYCLSGQLTIWLISIFGSTEALARIGALGRLAVVLTLVNVTITTLVVPRFARLPDQKETIIKRFFSIQAVLLSFYLVVVLFIYLFSDKILWILGSNYAQFDKEVILVYVGSCLSLISTCTHQLLASRGVIVPPAIFITGAVAVQVTVALLTPLNSTTAILYYGIYTTAAIYLMRLFYSYFAIMNIGLVSKLKYFYKAAYLMGHYPALSTVLLTKQKIFAYYGYLGDNNFGDELVFDSAREMLKPHLLIPVKKRMPLLLRSYSALFRNKFAGVVVGGGTIIGHIRERDFFESLVKLQKPVFVHGTGVHKNIPGRDAWRSILGGTIYGGVRGPMSANNLTQIVPNVPIVGDAALGFFDEKQFLAYTANPTREKKVLINLGTHTDYEGQTQVRDELKKFVKNLIQANYKVNFLAFHQRDTEISRQLIRDYPEIGFIDPPETFDQARLIFQQHSFAVGERLHFIVMASMAGCPFLSINYGKKHEDFLSSINLSKVGFMPSDVSLAVLEQAINHKDEFDWCDVAAKIQGFKEKQSAEIAKYIAATMKFNEQITQSVS